MTTTPTTETTHEPEKPTEQPWTGAPPVSPVTETPAPDAPLSLDHHRQHTYATPEWAAEIKRVRDILAADLTVKFFLGYPDAWHEAGRKRCRNNHVSTTTLKSERLGATLCLECGMPVWLTHPADVDGPFDPGLAIAATMPGYRAALSDTKGEPDAPCCEFATQSGPCAHELCGSDHARHSPIHPHRWIPPGETEPQIHPNCHGYRAAPRKQKLVDGGLGCVLCPHGLCPSCDAGCLKCPAPSDSAPKADAVALATPTPASMPEVPVSRAKPFSWFSDPSGPHRGGKHWVGFVGLGTQENWGTVLARAGNTSPFFESEQAATDAALTEAGERLIATGRAMLAAIR